MHDHGHVISTHSNYLNLDRLLLTGNFGAGNDSGLLG